MKRIFVFVIVMVISCVVAAQEQVQLTNLPTVYINTVSGDDPQDKINELRCVVTIIDGENRSTDSAGVRQRGNFSRNFPKKPYRIKFDKKRKVLGSPASAKKWTLINNYGDKTLMRNLLAFELSRRLEMPYTPFGRPVDVVMNGDYKGCYQLCDQIEVRDGRVEVDEGGFLIEADAYASDEDVYFYSAHGTPVSVHYPDSEEITEEQKVAIRDMFNIIEQSSHPNLDRETFIRHFLVGEISGNTDTYWSTYFYKRSTSDTVFTGPVWDFDIAFENDNRTYPICNHSDFIYRSGGSYAGDMKNFADQVLRTAVGRKQVETIYAFYRKSGALSAEAMIAVVDSLEQLIEASATRNFQRWPVLNECVHQNPRAGGSYKQEVQWVRDYLKQRFLWMDSKLNYSPESVEQTFDEERPRKEWRSGQVFIRHGNRIFDLTGREIGK